MTTIYHYQPSEKTVVNQAIKLVFKDADGKRKVAISILKLSFEIYSQHILLQIFDEVISDSMCNKETFDFKRSQLNCLNVWYEIAKLSLNIVHVNVVQLCAQYERNRTARINRREYFKMILIELWYDFMP